MRYPHRRDGRARCSSLPTTPPTTLARRRCFAAIRFRDGFYRELVVEQLLEALAGIAARAGALEFESDRPRLGVEPMMEILGQPIAIHE